MGFADIASPNAGSEAVHVVVGARNKLLRIRERHGRHNRPEDFFLHHFHLIVGVDQDGRLNEVSFLAALVATGDRLRALRETGFQITANAIHLFDRDQRPHLRVCIKPRPDSDLLRFFGHAFYHLVKYSLFHVQSRTGTATLSMIEEDGTGSTGNGDVHVGIFEHHVG